MRSLFLTASAAALALVAGAKSSDKVNWQNVTGTSSTAFPTAVGNLGDMLYAAPPFVAQENRVNSTSIPNTAIEMRWKPKDADKDNATSADIFRNLGAQSPYHPADDLFPETNAYQNVPEQCEIKQVHILHPTARVTRPTARTRASVCLGRRCATPARPASSRRRATWRS